MTSTGFGIRRNFLWLVVWFALSVGSEVVEIVTPESAKMASEEPKNVTSRPDSYVKAYEEVQKLRVGPAKRQDFQDPPDKGAAPLPPAYNTVLRSSPLPPDTYPSLTLDWTTMHVPDPPPTYGPPHSHHNLHVSPPHPPAYGPPHSHHDIHVSPPSCHQIPYSASSSSDSHFGLLPKKLGVKLLLKILLKLVLFKMIVKFIAVICLLLFIPVLKSKETSSEVDVDERKRARGLDMVSNMVWDGLEDKNALYGEDEESMYIREIAEQADDDGENEFLSGPTRVVRFLEFCVSAVDRVVGHVLGVLQRQRNEGEVNLWSIVFEKLKSIVKNI